MDHEWYVTDTASGSGPQVEIVQGAASESIAVDDERPPYGGSRSDVVERQEEIRVPVRLEARIGDVPRLLERVLVSVHEVRLGMVCHFLREQVQGVLGELVVGIEEDDVIAGRLRNAAFRQKPDPRVLPRSVLQGSRSRRR